MTSFIVIECAVVVNVGSDVYYVCNDVYVID